MTLCDALYRGVLKAGERFPTEVSRSELPPLFMARMGRIHRLARGRQEVVKKGALQPVKITVEMRTGNKKACSRGKGPLAAVAAPRFCGRLSVSSFCLMARLTHHPSHLRPPAPTYRR